MKTNSFREIFEKLKPLGINTQQELAEVLDITQSGALMLRNEIVFQRVRLLILVQLLTSTFLIC